ncbi:hypothetical protein LJR098_001118 [Rhizobium sp. LjRoot98]|uniref:hypothetical protein n=1 Tax=unclassified Rhizobium TaxID=2613769 RepID=UPI000715E1E6|nr:MULTISPECIES: hypothetical protein [unclassified Rhizobium]KQV41948.1 hypothetical protein ASC96_00885 [Rhizobium sp. Root1204]KQY17833.1 hypothetical protein ASD36_04240 [Rhizobium sp. Root1334]KRC13696.1 hypothetical protein ASE23_04240 [Rhizobium sp. Root73]
MKPLIFLSVAALMLASCTAPDVEPIPGSITYGGQPRTKLTKSPVGSVVHNSFRTVTGVAYETYIIQPDRSLKLIRREIRSDFFDQN